KVPEFLSGIGREVETHIPKLETAIGDLLKLLVARTLNMLGLWRPRADAIKA
uniref:Small ribosomal subunit protein mS41 SAM domain-containing protein n=2 Tax=Brassica oleracea TaxID=3712 RepID=A0A0D3AXD8_BRAOL